MKKKYFEYIIEENENLDINSNFKTRKEQLDLNVVEFFKNLKLGLDRIEKVNGRSADQVSQYNANFGKNLTTPENTENTTK